MRAKRTKKADGVCDEPLADDEVENLFIGEIDARVLIETLGVHLKGQQYSRMRGLIPLALRKAKVEQAVDITVLTLECYTRLLEKGGSCISRFHLSFC